MRMSGWPSISTFSIVGADTETGEIGVAVQSKFLAVGAAVPWVSADAGAIATQSWANTSYGARGLAWLKEGLSPSVVMQKLLAEDADREYRQVGIVDLAGRAATFTGSRCFDWAGGRTGPGYACQGNILAGKAVVQGMADAFVESAGTPLADRLVAALSAGQRAGGDRRGMQSAALYIAKPGGGYGGFTDRMIDLRVDDHPSPISELNRLLALHRLYFSKTRPDDWIPLHGQTLSEVQAALRTLGYDAGAANTYDAQARSALQAYCLTENFDERWSEEAQIDRLVLSFMQDQCKS